MRVTYVANDDWATIYIDGKNVKHLEGHSVRTDDLLFELQGKDGITDAECIYLDGTDYGREQQELGFPFPDNLEDIPR